MTAPAPLPNASSPWPHRLAVLLACATFPLLWVGGLVTTYDAGMAVPDWPTTYGHNPLAYPLRTWLGGPWDIFIEHAHRLLAGVINVIAVALVVVLWRAEGRPWVRRLGYLAVAGVLVQDLLGGLRVVLDERVLAQAHACVGPAFFALAALLAAITSSAWGSARGVPHGRCGKVRGLALLTALLAYLQIVLGSQVRHMPADATPSQFRGAVFFHLLGAALVAGHSIGLCWRMRRQHAAQRRLRRGADWLAVLVGVQILLGVGAWLVNYGWPSFVPRPDVAEGLTVVRGGTGQVLVSTAHVACGSLIVAWAASLAAWTHRLVCQPPAVAAKATWQWGGAG
jgi:cytochrome c oxidase assembly protein subunit 15